jgi:predicted metal-binding membrane protein
MARARRGQLFLASNGVMNLLWIAVLTAFVLLERVVPLGWRLGKISGALPVAGGIWMLLKAA